ncbi:hypothetical protein [Caudoviricetes sp.]|nr:hypothetical protein [Caudoviricetes sp.]
MSSLFRTPVMMAQPLPPPPSPTSDDPAVKAATEAAMENAQSVARKIKGRASTILTSGMGVEDDAVTSKKSLRGY